MRIIGYALVLGSHMQAQVQRSGSASWENTLNTYTITAQEVSGTWFLCVPLAPILYAFNGSTWFAAFEKLGPASEPLQLSAKLESEPASATIRVYKRN